MRAAQRTPEWFAERLGKVTASRIGDLMATTKSGPSASRANYMAELLIERLTGESPARFESDAMRWGTETEPLAITEYEMARAATVQPAPFVPHPSLAMSGASPDGYVGDEGLIEVKCPNSATHLATLKGAAVDRKYLLQMQWQMACTGRAWCDFVSYDPRFPQHLRLHVQRIPRDPALTSEIEAAVAAFLAELKADEEALALKEAA